MRPRTDERRAVQLGLAALARWPGGMEAGTELNLEYPPPLLLSSPLPVSPFSGASAGPAKGKPGDGKASKTFRKL